MRGLLFFFFLLNYVFAFEEITPIPMSIDYDADKASLGKQLFFDPVLSKDGTVSCVSCHNLPGSGTDNKQFSHGVDNQIGHINTPTVLNAGFNISQFWDGRAKDLHDQALMPILNSNEMGQTLEKVLSILNKSKYREKFHAVYGENVTKENLSDAIAEFGKTLITPNSRFDQYLRGNYDAITEDEKKGYQAFKDLGCISCHNGVNVGGNMYQKIGIMIPYDKPKDVTDSETLEGRYHITKRERDKRVFKVPSLRNIELTAPYIHDGRYKTLEDVIKDMMEHQLGITEEREETKYIKLFLKTLTGEMPKSLEELE